MSFDKIAAVLDEANVQFQEQWKEWESDKPLLQPLERWLEENVSDDYIQRLREGELWELAFQVCFGLYAFTWAVRILWWTLCCSSRKWQEHWGAAGTLATSFLSAFVIAAIGINYLIQYMNPESPFSAAMVDGIVVDSHRYDTVELMYFAKHDAFGKLGTIAIVGVIGHELVQCIFELEDLWNGANIIPAQLFCHPVTVLLLYFSLYGEVGLVNVTVGLACFVSNIPLEIMESFRRIRPLNDIFPCVRFVVRLSFALVFLGFRMVLWLNMHWTHTVGFSGWFERDWNKKAESRHVYIVYTLLASNFLSMIQYYWAAVILRTLVRHLISATIGTVWAKTFETRVQMKRRRELEEQARLEKQARDKALKKANEVKKEL